MKRKIYLTKLRNEELWIRSDNGRENKNYSFDNPRITSASDLLMNSKQFVEWDCLWFGMYPQTEIIGKAGYTPLSETSLAEGDYEVDVEIFKGLEAATSWDTNGDVILKGKKYRRLKSGDATLAIGDSDSFYKWGPDYRSGKYHYFRFDPIKWRVLHVEGNTALLLSDKVLDCRQFHGDRRAVTWKESTIRSFLNGYAASFNKRKEDYSNKNFLDAAFSEEEKQLIIPSLLDNKNEKRGLFGPSKTTDKIFLLSKSEVYSDNAQPYGFSLTAQDEGRRCRCSIYSIAMGLPCFVWYGGESRYSDWWLRSSGKDKEHVLSVDSTGRVSSVGRSVEDIMCGVRPALRMSLPPVNQLSHAGVVSSSHYNLLFQLMKGEDNQKETVGEVN